MRGAQVRTAEVTSLAGYISAIRRLTKSWDERWFRGHAELTWELRPGAYRPKGYGLSGEHDARDQFELRAAPLISDALAQTSRIPSGRWDWYFLMQHYGVPTRLLDWTESALIALYFALEAASHWRARCIWLLNPHKMNHVLRKEHKDFVYAHSDLQTGPYLSEKPLLEPSQQRAFAKQLPDAPIALQAPFATRRIAAQKGMFTLHGRMRDCLESLAAVQPHLAKIVIPGDRIGAIRDDLTWAGITRTVVFPELPALAEEIR